MIRVVVEGEGSSYVLDTPDSALIGPWLMALARHLQWGVPARSRFYTINVSKS